MTYSEFQNMYSQAYAEAEIKAAEIAAINEQINQIPQINVDEDIKNFQVNNFHAAEYSGESHLIGISQDVLGNQIDTLVNERSNVNCTTLEQLQILEQKKENVYEALANAYSQNELGDIVPIVEQEAKILESQPTVTEDAQHRIDNYNVMLNAFDKVSTNDVEDVVNVSENTGAYLTAVNHLSADGYNISVESFAESFAQNVNRDVAEAIKNNVDVKDVVESIKGSLATCEHIDIDLKEAADKALDKIIEADASIDLE